MRKIRLLVASALAASALVTAAPAAHATTCRIDLPGGDAVCAAYFTAVRAACEATQKYCIQ